MRPRKKKRSIGFFSRSILAFNVAAIVCLLLAYSASFIDPSTFWPIAFFGLAYPIFFLINIVFLIYWLVRKPVLALLSLAAILLGWKFLASTIGFRGETAIRVPKSSNTFLRVMTWNVHYFRKFNEQPGNPVDRDQMLEVIRNEQPDIICIQEYYTRRKGEFVMRKHLTEALNSNHYYIQETDGNDYETNGMAIFSKLKIKNRGRVLFSDSKAANQAIYTDFEFKKQRFRVYNVHLQSISFQPEDYKYLENVKEINTDIQSSKRIGSRLKNAFIKRAEQAELLKHHADSTGLPYIIAGDFNDTPVSYAVNTIAKGLSNSFRKKGSGFGITYNGDFPNFQIDYIFLTPHFDVKNYIIIAEKLSDHYPVRTDVELK
ncbi:endonuclease/exonuclease/phosphatase family protein [Pedobacter sp. SYSU D00535]|uniref:endonuclease/exonuclease/phosphatase family protein n=1 Tax=Pedobacter sp. SYSU D00535 TaxID=2810308 RepID=UPI001A9773A7|nr:endonuclease/exonuclease/phosphatase family protein [Pedobacter sp. SYSU D00535]